MRTLKKTLCFVLALVMVLGMGAFGVYAESTTSASTGDYTEASKVTEAIGVFIGGDGTDWSTPLTRAQAATLLCRLDGKTDDEINAMTISNTFTDLDPWAEPFVAYAEREGLILGVGGGRFDPQGALTGYQWALMLLRALGYTDAGEGINSDNWQVITARLSRQASLDKNIEDMSAQLSREEGAQMVYNALKADMVEYNNGVTVTTDGSTSVNVSGSRKERTTSANWGADIDNKQDSNGKYIIQLGESLFKGDLKLADDDRDDFGRPNCDTWKYKGKEIVTLAASDEHLVATHSGKVEYKDLYSDLGDTVVNSLKRSEYNYWSYVETYIDGKLVDTLEPNNLTRSNGDAILNTGNGSYTEVYSEYNSEYKAYIVTVVVVNTYLGKASGNYNSSKGELVIGAETYPSGGTLDSYKLSSDDIAGLDNFSDKDYLLYTCALVKNGSNSADKYEVKSVYAPTILEDVKVSSFKLNSSGNADNVTVDGSTYKYSKWASNDSTFRTLSTSYETNGDFTYDIYLDANNYVMFAEGHSAAGRYVYVESTDLKNNFGGAEVTLQAKVVNLEGVKSTVTISKVDNTGIRAYAAKNATDTDKANSTLSILNGDWFRYNVDTDGKYRLTSLSSAKSGNTNKTVSDTTFSKSSASVKSGTSTLYFDNATMFVVYDSASDVYHAYTGITNLPDIESATVKEAAVKTSNDHISYMYISASKVTDSGNVKWAFIRSTAIVESSNSNGKTTYTYNAIMVDDNGATSDTTITLGEQINDGAGLYYWYTTKDGMPNNLNRVNGYNVSRFNYQKVSSAKAISYDNGTVSCDGTAWAVNNDAQSWRIKNDDGSSKGGDADKLGMDTIVNHEYSKTFKGEIFMVYKSSNDKTITEIYFMYDGEPTDSSATPTTVNLKYVGHKGFGSDDILYYYNGSDDVATVKAQASLSGDDIVWLLYQAGYDLVDNMDSAGNVTAYKNGVRYTFTRNNNSVVQAYKLNWGDDTYYLEAAVNFNANFVDRATGKTITAPKAINSTDTGLIYLADNATVPTYEAYGTAHAMNKSGQGRNYTIDVGYNAVAGADLTATYYKPSEESVLTVKGSPLPTAIKITTAAGDTYYPVDADGTITIPANSLSGNINAGAKAYSFTFKATPSSTPVTYFDGTGTTKLGKATNGTALFEDTEKTTANMTYVAIDGDGGIDDGEAIPGTGVVATDFGTGTMAGYDGYTIVGGYYKFSAAGVDFIADAAKIDTSTYKYSVATTCSDDNFLMSDDYKAIYAAAGSTITVTVTLEENASAQDGKKIKVSSDVGTDAVVSTTVTDVLTVDTAAKTIQVEASATLGTKLVFTVTMAAAGAADTQVTIEGV